MTDWTTLDVEWPSDMDITVQVVVLGFVTLRLATMVWAPSRPGSWVDAIAVWALFAAGFALVAGAATGFDLKKWGRHLAALVLVAYALGTISMADRVPVLSTDAMMFTRQAADVFLAGGNPFEADMHASYALPGAQYNVSTARLDGSMVNSWSYPGGGILAAAGGRALDVQVRFVVLAAVVAIGALLVAVTPPEWALIGVGSLIIARDFFLGSLGGLIDPLWMLPVVGAMLAWASDRWLLAAFVLGIAVGTKQHAWVIPLYLAVWVYMDAADLREFASQAVVLSSVGAAGVLATNAPFIVMDPSAWLSGVLTPVRDVAMVSHGVGPALVTRLGLYPVASWWHSLAVIGVAVFSAIWYALYFERVKWLGWALPAAVLFVHYRSLPTYVLAWMPILWIAILAQTGRLGVSWPSLRPGGGGV